MKLQCFNSLQVNYILLKNLYSQRRFAFYFIFIYLFKYLFLYLCWVLVVACGIFIVACRVFSLHCTGFSPAVVCRLSSCGLQALEHAGSVVAAHGLSCPACGMWDLSSLTRDRTCVPCLGRQILNHWTSREVPKVCICF